MKKLFFTALLTLSIAAQDQNIFYKDADIKTFAQDIALLTDKTIILDPRVKGVISIYSDAPLNSESIWEVFISTMEVQGYNVLKDGDIYKVIPSQEGVKNFTESGPYTGSIGSEVIKLRFSSAKDIVNAVKPIVGVRSYIVALNNDREVLITDDADNIRRVREIIRNLDSELDTSISDFKLKNLSAIEALRLINSPFGMSFQAIKQNEERVKSVGIETFKVKLLVFVISGTITGLAGSLYTDLNRFVSPTVLDWQTSGEIMVFVILGGMARLYGPLVGAAFFIALEQTLGSYTENWQFWLGLILILVILYARSGILGLFDKKIKNEK